MTSSIQKVTPFLWVSSASQQTAAKCWTRRDSCTGVMPWPFQAVIYPKTIMAVRPLVGCHHIHCLTSPEFVFFFSFWSAPVSQGRAGSSDGPWAHCSPSALLNLAAGLQLHLEPWSYIKILKFSPNRICRWEQRMCCIARRFSLQTSSSP